MSRSYRKTKILGIVEGSEKKDKQSANRRFRRISKEKVNSKNEIPNRREVSNVWNFTKDGKRYIPLLEKKYMRK